MPGFKVHLTRAHEILDNQPVPAWSTVYSCLPSYLSLVVRQVAILMGPCIGWLCMAGSMW